MKNGYFQATAHEKNSITEVIKDCLVKRADITFVYLHGSFINDDRFHDVDVALFLKAHPPSSLNAELELEGLLNNAAKKYPIEVRILNHAPLSFRYNVIRHGQLLFSLDDDLRSNFVEATLRDYFDFAPFRKMYLKEVLGSGI